MKEVRTVINKPEVDTQQGVTKKRSEIDKYPLKDFKTTQPTSQPVHKDKAKRKRKGGVRHLFSKKENLRADQTDRGTS